MQFVKLAFRAVERRPERMVLLGAQPLEPEPEYGYVLPEGWADSAASVESCPVRRFVEKPDPARAEEIIRAGGLWNKMVLVFHTLTFLNSLDETAPEMREAFRRIEETLGSPDENEAVEET